MSGTRPEKLPRREREIMEILFASDEQLSAEDIRSRLTDAPSYSAVRAMLSRLEAKGYVRHREQNLRYVYSPTTRRTFARRAAVQQLVRVFFGGSASLTASELLRQESWTDEELASLSRQIERVRKERKQQ